MMSNQNGPSKAFFITLVLACVLFFGCGGSNPKQEGSAPPSREKALFFLDEDRKPSIVLKREGKDYSFPAERGFQFCVGDGVTNAAEKSIFLQSVEENVRFQLRPENRVQLDLRTLTIFSGSVRMEFRKIDSEYKIKLPTVTLGIRGTKLEASVASDGTSIVRLFEGAITISGDGAPTSIKEGETILFPPGAAPILNPPDSSIPKFLKDASNDDLQKAIQKF